MDAFRTYRKIPIVSPHLCEHSCGSRHVLADQGNPGGALIIGLAELWARIYVHH